MHDADALCLCIAGAIDLNVLAEIFDYAIVLLVDTSEDLHQRGLAGAVFTDQSHDFAGTDFQLCIVQCVNAGEILLNALHFQNCLAHCNITFLNSYTLKHTKSFAALRNLYVYFTTSPST